MKRSSIFYIFTLAIGFMVYADTSTAHASSMPLSLNVSPATISQGDPIMVTLSGTTTLPAQSLPQLPFFIYKGMPTAFYGIDLNHRIGTTSIAVTLSNGQRLSVSFFIAARSQPTEALPIPAQIGGNSTANQTRVFSILGTENAELAAITPLKGDKLWTTAFSYPIAAPVKVTDPYGYDRTDGGSSIAHKGVDFHAPPGTPVYAINDGVVRVAKTFVVYGNTVIVDHGVGLLSMYMHLSKIDVTPGQTVQKGQLLGLSGETGYAEGPHLHLTIRIGGISIDPMKFFGLMGVK